MFFSAVPSDRTRGSVHTLTHRRFPLNIRKGFFDARVTECWHRLPRKAMESPSLEIFRHHLDVVLGNLLEQAFEQDDLQRSLPTSALL